MSNANIMNSNLAMESTKDDHPVVDSAVNTIFNEDGGKVTVVKAGSSRLTNYYYKASGVASEDTLKDYLMKPLLIQEGSFSTTDTFSTFLRRSCPSAIIENATNIDVFSAKLKGYVGFRADMVFRLEINATRFHAGRYMLVWEPTGGVPTGTNTIEWLNWHASSLTARTQLYHAEIDVNCDTSVKLRVPYSSALNYYPLRYNGATRYDWGRIRIYPYEGLSVGTGSSSSISYSLYANFENIELIGAVIPQMGRVVKSRGVTEVEQDSQDSGPISSVLMKVSKASNILSEIPLLTHVTTPVSWVADVLARSAKVFGWSKPINVSGRQCVIRDKAPFFTNVEGIDGSLPLSLNPNNAIETIAETGGTDVDEMDFNFIKKIPAFKKRIPWPAAFPSGSGLGSIEHGYDLLSRVENTVTIYDLVPFEYLGAMFEYWRGSIIVTLKFVKTEFHSGRLLLIYQPVTGGIDAINPTTDRYTSAYAYRQIIDIRHTNEVTLKLPFISAVTWAERGQFAGKLSIQVLDKLVAPDTVTQTIAILCEVSAADDFEYAVPTGTLSPVPIFNVTPQSDFWLEDDIIEFQSGDGAITDIRNDCELTNTTIGGVDKDPQSVATTALCMGESITSLRAYLKRYHFYAITTFTNRRFLNYIPFSVSVTWLGASSVGANVETPDLYSSVSCLYLYSKGGVRFSYALTDPSNAQTKVYLASLGGGPFDNAITTSTTDISGVNTMRNKSLVVYPHVSQNRHILVTVPGYNQLHQRVNIDLLVATGNLNYGATSVFAPNTGLSIVHKQTGADCNVGDFARAMSEDCNFSQFVSVGPMMLVYTPSTEIQI